MKSRLPKWESLLLAALLGGIPLARADTVDRLQNLLTSLSEYEFGDSETWRPELIEVMRTIYREPDTQTTAAGMMHEFLNSNASPEAKNAVQFHYDSLVDPATTPSLDPDRDIAAASPLMAQVARLNREFEHARNPVAFLKRKLKTEPPEQRPYVIRLVRSLPGSFRKGASFLQIEGLNNSDKAQLLRLLANRGDPSIHQLASQYAKSSDRSLRIAALESLQKIGGPEDVPLLLEIAVTGEAPEQSLAQDALHRMPGEDVDLAIAKRLLSERLVVQLEVIKAIEKRNTQSATGDLLSLASENGDAQMAAIRALALTASLSQLDAVIDTMAKADSSKAKKELGTAVYRIAYRHGDSPKAVEIIRERLKVTDDDSLRAALADILDKLDRGN